MKKHHAYVPSRTRMIRGQCFLAEKLCHKKAAISHRTPQLILEFSVSNANRLLAVLASLCIAAIVCWFCWNAIVSLFSFDAYFNETNHRVALNVTYRLVHKLWITHCNPWKRRMLTNRHRIMKTINGTQVAQCLSSDHLQSIEGPMNGHF